MADQPKRSTVKFKKMERGPRALPEGIRGWLVVVRGPDAGEKFPITSPEVTLGRDADITIQDESASRLHARISFRDNEFRIEDLSSANGTLLNGSQVKAYALKDGDKVTVGQTVLEFHVQKAAAI